MEFRYETHLHTNEASACASASGAEQARRFKALGYDGIIVTDHFFNGNCAVKNFSSWEDRVEKFCRGFENAKAEGDKIGLKVFFGFEYSYFGADLLTYGLDKKWLMENTDISDMSLWQFYERVHASGGFIVHAHPFREAEYISEIKLLPQWVDGVEVFNCGNRSQKYNDRALWYANEYDKPVTAGSDTHNLSDSRISGISTVKPLESIKDYIWAVKNREVKIIIP